MSIFKKFLNKTKTNAKFKMAGPGHKLNDSSTSSSGGGGSSSDSKPKQAVHVEPTQASRQAAEAALARLQKKEPKSLSAVQAQVRREMEAEKKHEQSPEPATPSLVQQPKVVEIEEPRQLSVAGVFFRCPLYDEGQLVLCKDEWRYKLKEYIFNIMDDEGQAACLTIRSCNDRKIVEPCINMLDRCIGNIIDNPDKVEFRKIRVANKTMQSKVLPVIGAIEFLFSAGYRMQQVFNEKEGHDEDCFIISEEAAANNEALIELRQNLKEEDRIELELDRNVQYLTPADISKGVELPEDFFRITKLDVMKEQQLKSDVAEKELQLRTQEMRENDKRLEHRIYMYTLIRIRFPDSTYLQGTFSVDEKGPSIFTFVRSHLEIELPCVLTTPDGQKLHEDSDLTLDALKLVPAAVLNFQWDPKWVEEGQELPTKFLKLSLEAQSL